MSGYLYSARPLKAKDEPAPGAALMRGTERLGRLSPVEARALAADLILSASASEAQWPKETAEETEDAAMTGMGWSDSYGSPG